LLALAACAGPRDSAGAGTDADGGVSDAGDAGDDAGETDAGDAGETDAGVDAGSDAGTDAGATGTPDAGTADAGTNPLITARPYTLHVPAGWDGVTPAPLLLMFHGYGSNGADHESYLKFTSLSDKYGFLYAYADGTVDRTFRRFWEGTDACCDLFFTGQNDVVYVDAILDDVAMRHPVDLKRVYAFGHSNGGFMVHRLACDRADRFAAIVSLAGAVFDDASKCHPFDKIAVLQIHGDADQTISYNGGRTGPIYAAYPSAHGTVAQWAAHDGCTSALTPTGITLDIDSDIAGNETTVEAYPGCPIELWTIHGGPHVPPLTPGWAEPVWAFFAAHPKP
jgi:polyhydroxybutyrate depolymerase